MTALRSGVGPAGPAAVSRRPGAVRRDLEGLRAVAVVGVVVYHLRPSWLPGGFVGVDVFFVLSGFLITGLLVREAERSGSVDLVAFWGRRARRLLPAAALVMIASALAGLFFVNSIDARRFAVDGGFAAVFAVNWHYAALGTSYLADTDPSPLTHYWSLGVEEQFYLVWPVALLVVAIVTRRSAVYSLRAIIGGLAAVIAIVSFLVAWHLTAGAQPYAYFATYSRAWQLALGAGLAVAAPVLARLRSVWRVVARWAGLAMIVGFYLLAPLDVVYPGGLALVPALGAAAIIAAGVIRPAGDSMAARGDPVARALGSDLSQRLGRYSYGWYLWHWPPLVLVPLAIGHPLSVRDLLACAVLSLGCAVVSYHALENPVRASRTLSVGRGRRSLFLAVVIVALGLGAAGSVRAVATWRTEHSRIETASGLILRPQPGAAINEQPQPQRDGCEVGITSTAASPECRYLPAAGRGDVVLVGDSHATQWYPAMHDVARSQHWGLRVWSRQSCPLADVSKPISGGLKACDRWRSNVMTRLLAAHPSLVVVAGYDSVAPTVYDRVTNETVHGPAAQTLYENGLRKEVRILRNAGIAVLLIRDNPAYRASAPKCVLDHPTLLDACSAPRTAALGRVELDVATTVPGVQLLDLSDVFCDRLRCHQVIGSTLAYRDTNHLTVEMVDSLVRPLSAAAARAARP